MSCTSSPYLTHAEAAAYCRLSPQTLYNRRSEIPTARGVRGRNLYRKEDLDAWLAAPPKRTTRRRKPGR